MWKYSQWFIIFGSLLFGWPSSVRPSYREMSYSILHQHPMDRGQMREQFRGGCQSCLRLKILNMWIISMSTISQWATRGYSKFPILFPSYPSTFHIVEAKQLAKVSYLWHAATIHDAYALNSSKLVLNVKHNYISPSQRCSSQLFILLRCNFIQILKAFCACAWSIVLVGPFLASIITQWSIESNRRSVLSLIVQKSVVMPVNRSGVLNGLQSSQTISITFEIRRGLPIQLSQPNDRSLQMKWVQKKWSHRHCRLNARSRNLIPCVFVCHCCLRESFCP